MPIRVQVVGHGIVEFPDGTPQQEMQTALDSLSASSQAAPTPQKTSTPFSSVLGSLGDRVRANLGVSPNASPADVLAAAQTAERQRTQTNARYLPTVGGAIGGMVGSIPGAAVGGAVGEATKEVVDPTQRPATVGEQAKAIGLQGAEQGAWQAAGEGIAAGAGKLGKWLMNRATTRVTAKLSQDFPELSDTLIDNALTVSQGGYDKAKGLLLAAKSKATAALAKAEATGATVPVQLTPELGDSLKTALLEKAVKSGAVPSAAAGAPISLATARLDPATQTLFSQIDQAASSGNPLSLTPRQADLFKTQLQKESRNFYANFVAPNGQKAMPAASTLKADFASQLNSAIDTVAQGYKAANAQAQPLIGAVRGIKQAIRPSGNLYQAMVRPGVGAVLGGLAGSREGNAPVGAMIGAAAASPQGMSIGALALAHPAFQLALKQLPRAVADSVISAIQAHLQEQTPPTPLER